MLAFREMGSLVMPREIVFGWECSREIPAKLRRMGVKKVLIITDEGLVKAGIVDKILEFLKRENLAFSVFDGVRPEPKVKFCYDALSVLIEEKCDGIIGLGGGSSIDVAKVVSVLATNEGKVEDFLGFHKIGKPGLPKVFIPTTAGTGSEVTWVSVLTNEEGVKVVIYSFHLLADIAFVDPSLTVSLPPKITAYSGMDALCHAIEAYTSVDGNVITDLYARKAIELIGRSLRGAVLRGDRRLDHRQDMAMAALLAGMAFSNAGCNAVHALALALGSKYHLPHGLTNAVMLPHVIKFNFLGNLEKFAEIFELLGGSPKELSLREKASKCSHLVEELLGDIGLPLRLRDIGMNLEDLDELTELAFSAQRLLVHNPRIISKDDIKMIFKKAW